MFTNYYKEAFLLLTQQNFKFRMTNILIKDIKIVIRFFSNSIRMVVQYRPITYIKIRVPFQVIFKDSNQKPHPHILKLRTFRISSRTIHTIIKHYF